MLIGLDPLRQPVLPGGRFALVLSRDQGVLYQIPLVEDATPVAIFDDTEIASLPHVHGLQTFRHDNWTIGRQVVGRIKDGSTLTRLLLYDFENDGVFDVTHELTNAGATLQNLPESWVEDYVNYSGIFAPSSW